MFRTFNAIESHLLASNVRKTIALAGSEGEDALHSVVMARRKGLVRALLVGDIPKTRKLLQAMNEPEEYYEFIEEAPGRASARRVCQLVVDGKAHLPMKGDMQTVDFMRAILDKSFGFFAEKALLSQATVLEFSDENRLMVISDCAVNVAPDYSAKVQILNNAVGLARKLGIECPKAAVVTPLEIINPAIQSTVDAAMLSKAAQRGQITGCIVDGPLALDNAMSRKAAKHKGIESAVSGCADILLMPDLAAGNIFTKSLLYFAHLKQSGSLLGSKIPVIMSSRTDTAEDKYYAILIAVLMSL